MSKYYFVGSGIASLAGAAYLIRDGKVDGSDIAIFEESRMFGGSVALLTRMEMPQPAIS